MRERDINKRAIRDAVERGGRRTTTRDVARETRTAHGHHARDKNYDSMIGRHLSENRRDYRLKREKTTPAMGTTYTRRRTASEFTEETNDIGAAIGAVVALLGGAIQISDMISRRRGQRDKS